MWECLKENIEISEFSTFLDNEHYFSYRKENAQTGRMLVSDWNESVG
jgi:copper oxidase (laccase) domain-containing protein